MPAKMMSEMPLPMPRSVICSPSHMMKAVPVVSVIIVMQAEAPARIGHDLAHGAVGAVVRALEPARDAERLDERQDDACRSACTG